MSTAEIPAKSRQVADEGDALQEPSSISRRILSHLSRQTSSGRYIPEMDGLRFVAIGMVFLFHLNGYLITKSSPHYSLSQHDWLEQAANVGFRGVELFFVISGFILGLPFAAYYRGEGKKVNLRKYYLRRLTRLEPPYLVAMLGLFGLALALQGPAFVDRWKELAASLVYQHGIIYGTIIGVSWSLEIEVQFYLLVPLLTFLFAIRSVWVRRAVIVALILAVQSIQPFILPGHPRLSLSILAYLQFFLTGFLLTDVFLAEWRQAPRHSLYWDAISLAGWPALFVILHFFWLQHWLFPGAIFVLYCGAFRGSIVNRLFINPWITVIGGMCYSIYLIHYEVISAVARFTRNWSAGAPYWLHLLVQSAIVGSGVLAVCTAFFLLVEKPCMQPDWPQRLWKYVSKSRVATS